MAGTTVSWELGVAWVLQVPDGVSASAGDLERPLYARSWIKALAKIMESLRCVVFQFEEEHEADVSSVPDPFQFAQFMQETMLRMLAFVDVMVALDSSGVPVPALQHRISILLRVRSALSEASSDIEGYVLEKKDIEGSLLSTPSPEVDLIGNEMLNLLTAKDGKAGEAIWSTLEEVRTRFLHLMKDSSATSQTPQGSSGIHKVTLSVMDHINFLMDNYSSVSPIVYEATSQLQGNYVPHRIGHQPHLDTMIMEMASRLQEKLSNMSESFPDQGLKFLFLFNNSDFIRERLLCSTWRSSSLQVHAAALLRKVEGYMESYLQVSWAPVLSCLFNPTPLCLFGKYYYPQPLPNFESEFQKMYATQKFWKVPDPELRASLRTAITEKIIPGYTKYIEENDITKPRISPQELEGMLQKLFEG
ncbi:unnamed protein product [Urochloa humidicola]